MTDRLLTIAEVREQVRLSEPTIYRLRRKGKFPQPVVIGERKIAWRQSDVDAYLGSLARANTGCAA